MFQNTIKVVLCHIVYSCLQNIATVYLTTIFGQTERSFVNNIRLNTAT